MARTTRADTYILTAARRSMSRGTQGEYWISDASRDKIVDTVSGIFKEELSKANGWEAAIQSL